MRGPVHPPVRYLERLVVKEERKADRSLAEREQEDRQRAAEIREGVLRRHFEVMAQRKGAKW